MEKIKVLWIITTGLRKNGICVSQLDYYKLIDKDKFQIDIVSFSGDNKEMVNEYREANCRIFNCPGRANHLFKYLRSLKKILKTEKYDIIHVHGSSSLMILELFVAKLCCVKVRIAHSRNTTCDRPWLEKYLWPFFKRTYNVALACGVDAGKWLFKNEKFIVFHNGKNAKKYKFNLNKRNEMRRKLKLDKEIAIGHVGLFNDQKNHAFLIDVFKKINDENSNTKLYLMGNGKKINEIKDKVNKMQLNDYVVFLGTVNNMSDYLQAMDIMLFPSFFEGLPNVVIEWQFSGLPVIISDKITKECVVCDFVKTLPINQGPEIWSNYFKKIKLYSCKEREQLFNESFNLLKKSGFEINTNVKLLEKLYIEKLKEFGR